MMVNIMERISLNCSAGLLIAFLTLSSIDAIAQQISKENNSQFIILEKSIKDTSDMVEKLVPRAEKFISNLSKDPKEAELQISKEYREYRKAFDDFVAQTSPNGKLSTKWNDIIDARKFQRSRLTDKDSIKKIDDDIANLQKDLKELEILNKSMEKGFSDLFAQEELVKSRIREMIKNDEPDLESLRKEFRSVLEKMKKIVTDTNDLVSKTTGKSVPSQ